MVIEKIVAKVRMKDKKNNAAFWRSQLAEDRIAAVEKIREEYHRWKNDARPGFQRVCRIIKRGENSILEIF